MYDFCLKSTKVLHRRYSGYRQSVDFQRRYTEIVIVSTEVVHLVGNDYLCEKQKHYGKQVRSL